MADERNAAIAENANVAVADEREGDVRWPGCD